jgi:hypothetical protein
MMTHCKRYIGDLGGPFLFDTYRLTKYIMPKKIVKNNIKKYQKKCLNNVTYDFPKYLHF